MPVTPKPSAVPEWNSGGANNTEPSAGKKTLGYTLNDQPVSGHLNWWMKLVYDWSLYLRDLFSRSVVGSSASESATNAIGLDFTGKGNAEGVVGRGGSNGGTGVAGIGGATNGTGVTGTGGATNGYGGAFYGAGTGLGLYAVGGASAGSGGINAAGGTGGGVGADCVSTGTAGTYAAVIGRHSGGATDKMVAKFDGAISLNGGNAPAVGDELPCALTKKNIVIARALITLDNTEDPTVLENYNFSSIQQASTGEIEFEFRNDPTNANYSVNVTIENPQDVLISGNVPVWLPVVLNRLTTAFEVECHAYYANFGGSNWDTGKRNRAATNLMRISVVVTGGYA